MPRTLAAACPCTNTQRAHAHARTQVFNVPGRCFPVDVIHSLEDHQRDYVDAAVDVVLQVHIQQPPGASACLDVSILDVGETGACLAAPNWVGIGTFVVVGVICALTAVSSWGVLPRGSVQEELRGAAVQCAACRHLQRHVPALSFGRLWELCMRRRLQKNACAFVGKVFVWEVRMHWYVRAPSSQGDIHRAWVLCRGHASSQGPCKCTAGNWRTPGG